MTESPAAAESPFITRTSEFIDLSHTLGAKLFDLTQKNAKHISADEFIAGLPPQMRGLPLFKGKAKLLHQHEGHPRTYNAPVLRVEKDATTFIEALHDPSAPPASIITQIDHDGIAFRLSPTKKYWAHKHAGVDLQIGKAVQTDTGVRMRTPGNIRLSITGDGFAHEHIPFEGINFDDALSIVTSIISGKPVPTRLWLRDAKRYGSAPQPLPFEYSRDK